MPYTCLSHSFSLVASDYKLGGDDPNEQYHDTKAGSGVTQAVWLLLLALLVKAVLTIFTFGIKVWDYTTCTGLFDRKGGENFGGMVKYL